MTDPKADIPPPPPRPKSPDNGNTNVNSFIAKTGTFDGEFIGKLSESRTFIKRFEKCIAICNWKDPEITSTFSFCLKGVASMWMDNLVTEHPTKSRKWEFVRNKFMKRFDQTGTPQDRLQTLAGLEIKKGETSANFATRVEYTLNLLEMAPGAVPTDQNEARGFTLGRDSVKQENKMLYFVNGLRPSVKRKILSNPDITTFEKMVLAATQAENAESQMASPIASLQEEGIEEGTSKPKMEKKSTDKKEKKALNLDQLQEQITAINNRLMPKRNGNGNGQRRGRGGRGSYNRGRGGPRTNNQRIHCFRCRRWGNHRAATCPVPADQLASISPEDPNYDGRTMHPYEPETYLNY